MSTDPAESYLPPDGVARMVHSDLPSMLIGGISALLLQTLHPLAMAGVAEHSNYQADPLGRLRRTADFVGTTTFGTVQEAEKAVQQVRRVHRRVTGVAPDGRPYSAGDPELVTFIHAAEVSSFLESSRRFGPRDLTPEQCDQYYEEMAPVALALGAEWVPRSTADVEDYFRRQRHEFHAGPQALQARDWLRHGVSQASASSVRSTTSCTRPRSAPCPPGPAASSASRLLARSTCWWTPWPSSRPRAPSPPVCAGWPPPGRTARLKGRS